MAKNVDANGGDEDLNVGKIKKSSKSSTPILDFFGRDLTALAKIGALDKVIGRDVEIKKIVQILGKRKKNNPLIVGFAGTGKSAIVEGLAIMIASNEVDKSLHGKRLIELNLNSIVSGTKFRGQFEERVEEIIQEIKSNPDVIVFIDEIHNVMGAGGASGTMDFGNIIKPYLSRGEIRCIGATTFDEYKKHIENDSALDRRFQKVIVDEPSVEESIVILEKSKAKYESFHNVKYSGDVISACVHLSHKYITSRKLPDKAFDLMDEVASYVKTQNGSTPSIIIELGNSLNDIELKKAKFAKAQQFEDAAKCRDEQHKLMLRINEEKKKWQENSSKNVINISVDDVTKVMSDQTGIPVQRLSESEKSRVSNMEIEIQKRIIGQNPAIAKVADAIKRSKVGIQDPKRPIASFMFLGPTGTGKTELCKELATFLFDSEKAMIKIDMSEYMDKASSSKLIGSPPGYIGYDEKGQLTERVKNKPYSIVLFDEIEKAHPDIFDILLQILDEGKLTDSTGVEVNFKNTIIIMTSNVGTSSIIKSGHKVGFKFDGQNLDKPLDAVVMKELENKFRPEFLNRIDEIVIFDSLKKQDVEKIVKIHVDDLVGRLLQKGFEVSVDDAVYSHLADIGYDEKYGARPLKRAIIKNIESPIASTILEDKTDRKKFVVSLEDNIVVIK